MAAELADGLQRSKRAEADTREAQAALEVDVEGRHKEGDTRVSATSSHSSLLLLIIASSFVLPCSYIENKIYSLSHFAHHQLIY